MSTTLGRWRGNAGAPRKYLLLDSRNVLASLDAKLVPGEVVKHPGNPVLSDDAPDKKPWELRFGNMQPNVFHEEGRYRLLYSAYTSCENVTTGTADTC